MWESNKIKMLDQIFRNIQKNLGSSTKTILLFQEKPVYHTEVNTVEEIFTETARYLIRQKRIALFASWMKERKEHKSRARVDLS